MVDIKLKPCPFCGSTKVEIFEPVNSIHIKPLQGGKIGRAIICNDCDVRISFPQAYDEVHAAEFWNDRKIETEPVKHGKWIGSPYNGFGFVCSECNSAMLVKTNYCHRCGAKMDEGGNSS